MPHCKRCHSESVVKSGIVRNSQRYQCKECGYNFIEGDSRINANLPVKKALAVILHCLGKASFNMMGHIFGVSQSMVHRWIVQEAENLQTAEISGSIAEMEFDEMWHFISSKKGNDGASAQWIVAEGELWPGSSVIVAVQPSTNNLTQKQ
ncbi:MAG: hypothetical protein LBQ58_10010 [Synergistaceae bacterium]|jgi:transposase-like protein|nr:hypothetical protein [Synergistaceae bacterium]